MKLDRVKNTKRGITAGAINRLVNLLFPFIVQTITIKTLGVEYAGVKGLFTSILSVLSLTELGVGSAIVFSMYKPIAEDDIETICSLLNLYKKLYCLIGFAISIIGLIITPFLNVFIRGSYPEELNIRWIFLLYLLNTVISYWMYAYKSSLLSAHQRTDIINNVGTITFVSMSIVQIAILLCTKNFYLYLSISIIFTIINNLMISARVDRMYPEIRCRGTVVNSLISDIKTKIAGLMISKVCVISRNAFDIIFMSMFLGLTDATIYSNYYYILAALNSLVRIISTSLLAGIGNSVVTQSKSKNYSEMIRLNALYLILGGLMAICMLCLYQPFMVMWMGDELLFPNYIMAMFPIYFYIEKMGDIRGVYSDAAGLFWENRHRSLLEAIANVILNYVFVLKWGAFGILLATILTLFFIGFIGSTIVIFKYYFENGLAKYLKQQVLYALLAIAVGAICYILCQKVASDLTFISFVKRIIVCIVVAPTCYWLVLNRTKDYRENKAWVISIIKKDNLS